MQVPKFLLTQTCVISNYLGQTPSGPSYDTSYNAICRFENSSKVKKRIKKETSGTEFMAKGILFLLPTAQNKVLSKKTKITIDSVDYFVEEMNIMRGMRNSSHIEILLY